ncbi:MAG: glycosyltransferase family 4 protein [Clostridiales bacterium]|nr:glycosyltransferase family 4 protein [Clostridiales bacterium]
MNIIFAHDHRFKEDSNGNLYSGNDFNAEIWKRYKTIGENITVIARCEKVYSKEKLNGYTLMNEENVKLVKMPNVNNIKELIIKNRQIKSIIAKEVAKSDGIIIRLPSTIGNLVCSEAKKQNKKYFIELVGCPWGSFWNHGSLSGKICAPIYYYLTKMKIRESKYVIYVTNEFLQQRYPNKHMNIGCSDVSISMINNYVLENRIRKFKEKNIINLGLIGSLDVNYKGHETAIKALKEIVNCGYKINLRLIGPGDSKRWQKLAEELGVSENVYFDGLKKSGDEVYDWLDNIDIYIQPSLIEGLPRAVVEAQSRGCATIVTNCGGMNELVDKEFIVNRKDYKNLASKILILINNEDLLEEQYISNFEKSKLYDKNKLDSLRFKFYDDFKKYIRSN